MRELKFRAWDRDGNRMMPVMGFDTYSVVFATDEKRVTREDERDITLCELMQFTGLLDKNGNEIYEGDIVLVNGGQATNMAYPDASHESIEHKGAVQFHGGSFYIGGVIGDWPLTDDREVIGNIYEDEGLTS